MPTVPVAQALQLAIEHHQAGRLKEAESIYRQVLASDPGNFDALRLLGLLAQQLRQHDAAIELLGKAARSQETADVLRLLADSLMAVGRFEESIPSLARVAALEPSPKAHYNLGVALQRTGRREDALVQYRNAIALDPQFAEAHFNIGSCLAPADVEAARESFANAARLQPKLMAAQEILLHLNHYSPDADRQDVFEQHRRWARTFADPLTAAVAPHANDRNPDRRLRVGYVSPDFRRHSVSYFFEPLLAAHHENQVETFCYADEIASDATTFRLQPHADVWRNITGITDPQAAEMIRDDRIDILVDLTGHVEHNRLLVFARKPAPVQVSYLGYPDTTGLATIDYRITDALADPPGLTEQFYTEQLIRLPACAWCYQPESNAPPPQRLGGGITFGCFNSASKINSQLVEMWAAILRKIPEARMIIKDGQGSPSPAHPRIRNEFVRQSIDPARVELLSFVPDVREHMALYQHVDIALDTLPYNGTTTTCEALWMGVPVVSLIGERHLSRVGLSLLSCVGLRDLVASSPAEYVEIAVRAASDSARLSELRTSLRERMRASPLMDAQKFARDIEEAYRQMWRRWCGEFRADAASRQPRG